MRRVLVTGGNGNLGRDIVRVLLAGGWPARVMSRQARPTDAPNTVEWATADLKRGDGLTAALEGVGTVVHAASHALRRDSWEVDVNGTPRLLEAARAAGVEHIVYISIIGIDRVPFGYYHCKLAAETLVERGGVPWSILRASQFYSLIDLMLQPAARLPVALTPTGFVLQSMDQREAAARLVEAVAAGPAGRLPEIAGPEVRVMRDLAAAWLRAHGLRRPIVDLPLWGGAAAGFRRGGTTNPEAHYGRVTWEEWLREQTGAPAGEAQPMAKGGAI
jgi:uncharacterized protein YbjT (DUF2867 family)